MQKGKSNNELIIVGIGASAGGLEALQSFLKYLPVDTNFAYITAQHLSPTYKSMMVDLLSKDSPIEIKEAKNSQKILANTMYICPPNKNIIIEDEQIILLEPKQLTYGPRPSINILFESIAANKQSKAIGIILSGTGSDGSRGLKVIKAEGGFTIAQQPQSAKYDGMPNSAINTGNVDLILDVEVMGHEILEIINYPDKVKNVSIGGETTQIYKNILNKLQRNKNIDFSLYKSSTINRRIERRMAALKITNLNNYSTYLTENEEEIESLFNDILIGVTSFFRDEDAFNSLSKELTSLINKKENKNIRIWAPGCSTGEEAYSIAILLSEILDKNIIDYKIQIFATDIDDRSTSFARMGRYPESALLDIDKKYVKKYFTVKSDEYEVIKPIREMCIFSKHDITNDPAFMRLDLIVCRNLLIYFTTELQQKLFPIFHYSLNDNGILFLGKSESIGSFNNQFKIVDKKWKLYHASYLGQKIPPVIHQSTRKSTYKKFELESNPLQNMPTISDMIVEHIQRHIIPKCIVINDIFDMIFIKGKNPYLIYPEGEITQNVFRNIHNDLSMELRAALHTCKKKETVVKTTFHRIKINNEEKFVRLIITPLDNALTNDLYLVAFQEEDDENLRSYDILETVNNSNEEVERLNLELARTREHLQTVVEELETSNEEMQSLNEELQSSNEELQSSNEELETTNEELQSTNEELQTAYTEMRSMFEERDNDAQRMSTVKNEVENSNFRLQSVLNSAKIGIFDYDVLLKKQIFIDNNWANIFGFEKEEILDTTNDIMSWFETRIHPEDIDTRTRNFEKLLLGKQDKYEIELRVLGKNNEYKWIKCFTNAIKDKETGVLKKILNTLIDISKDKDDLIEMKSLSYRLDNAIKLTKLGTWEWNLQKDNIWWSSQMYSIYGFSKNEPLSVAKVENIIHPEDLKKHHDYLEEILMSGEIFNIEYRIIVNNKIKNIWAKGTVIKEGNKATHIVGVVQEIIKPKENLI